MLAAVDAIKIEVLRTMVAAELSEGGHCPPVGGGKVDRMSTLLKEALFLPLCRL